MYFNQEELNIYNLNKLAAGSDEAGRGCLAGPVFAASVILPNNFDCSIIDDSKKLTLHQRNLAYEQLIDKSIDYSIDSTDNFEIVWQACVNAFVWSVSNCSAMAVSMYPRSWYCDNFSVTA